MKDTSGSHQETPVVGSSIATRSVLCVVHESQCIQRALVGHQLVFAANAFESIRESNARIFDAYLIDYWLPDWSGVQLCKHFRKTDPHIPILICNAGDQHLERERARRAGANACFLSPLETEVLRSTLATMFDRADQQTIEATVKADCAIHEELARQLPVLRERAARIHQTAVVANERITKGRALEAFTKNGGALSKFDRWWPGAYAKAEEDFAVAVMS